MKERQRRHFLEFRPDHFHSGFEVPSATTAE